MDRPFQNKRKHTGNGSNVLIPVDFSAKGFLAVSVGFELARRLQCDAVLLHASVVPSPPPVPQFPDDFNGIDNEEAEMQEVEMERDIHAVDVRSMDELKSKISSLQKKGSLADVKFTTLLEPGMPEEVIAEYCTLNPPKVVVMATRSREKRLEELIGSVTAEVIDHGYAPVLSVPEEYSFHGFRDIVRICAFCHLDQGDFAAISKLLDMFNRPEVKIFLFPAVQKVQGIKLTHELRMLQTKLKNAFPNSDFIIPEIENRGNAREEVEALFKKEDIQMILAPNRYRNALSRFFNPGLAHKILYEIDFPMLAIPVPKS